MKSLALSVVTVFLFFIVSCTSSTDGNINEKTEKATINSSEVFEYQTGIAGDEESAAIAKQPDHYEISEIVRDSTTDGEAVYRYKAESGFEGTDQLELKLGTGSDGAGPNTNITLVTIEITVN